MGKSTLTFPGPPVIRASHLIPSVPSTVAQKSPHARNFPVTLATTSPAPSSAPSGPSWPPPQKHDRSDAARPRTRMNSIWTTRVRRAPPRVPMISGTPEVVSLPALLRAIACRIPMPRSTVTALRPRRNCRSISKNFRCNPNRPYLPQRAGR
jgi:hypothetical protein